MKIQLGEIQMNKTKKYLLPCLKAYGEEFEKKFNFVFKVAVGIGDMLLVNAGVSYEKHMFILLDTNNGSISNPKVGQKHFQAFLQWVRQQDMFEEDYAFDSIVNSRLHMIVIKLPSSCYKAYEQMKRSQFSKMFTLAEIEEFFKDKPDTQQVLIKDHNYRMIYAEQLNMLFGTAIQPNEAHEIEGELDLPLRKEEEYFGNNEEIELGRS